MDPIDLAALALRLLLGGILLCHGVQKAFGWLHGHGLAPSAAAFHELGQRPAPVMVRLAVVCEFVSGMLLVLGLATPLAAAIATGTMLVAGAAMTLKSRVVWNVLGGGEYPLVLAALGVIIAFLGPRTWSLDNLLGWTWPPGIALAAVVVAVVAAAPPVVMTQRNLRG